MVTIKDGTLPIWRYSYLLGSFSIIRWGRKLINRTYVLKIINDLVADKISAINFYIILAGIKPL